MSSPAKYYIGIDFGSKVTRAAILVESLQTVKLYDLIEVPLQEEFANNSERYKAGLLDISNYLKAKKIILKSAVTNLDNRFIRAIPHVVEIKNRIPFNVYGVVVQEKDIDFSKEKENGFGDLLVDSFLIRIKK